MEMICRISCIQTQGYNRVWDLMNKKINKEALFYYNTYFQSTHLKLIGAKNWNRLKTIFRPLWTLDAYIWFCLTHSQSTFMIRSFRCSNKLFLKNFGDSSVCNWPIIQPFIKCDTSIQKIQLHEWKCHGHISYPRNLDITHLTLQQFRIPLVNEALHHVSILNSKLFYFGRTFMMCFMG